MFKEAYEIPLGKKTGNNQCLKKKLRFTALRVSFFLRLHNWQKIKNHLKFDFWQTEYLCVTKLIQRITWSIVWQILLKNIHFQGLSVFRAILLKFNFLTKLYLQICIENMIYHHTHHILLIVYSFGFLFPKTKSEKNLAPNHVTVPFIYFVTREYFNEAKSRR